MLQNYNNITIQESSTIIFLDILKLLANNCPTMASIIEGHFLIKCGVNEVVFSKPLILCFLYLLIIPCVQLCINSNPRCNLCM